MRIDRPTISGWIRDQNSSGINPVIHGGNVADLALLRKPNLRERSERYLLAAANRCATLQATFVPVEEDLIGISSSADKDETMILARHLIRQHWLEERSSGGPYRVTPEGHIAADDLRTHRTKSSQGIVAMWFSPEMTSVYDDGLSRGIQSAGYKPMRVDQKEHANKIDDEIIAEIRRSAFLAADFTGHRGGVYFDAGFAVGLGFPVIWMCRKDGINEFHFDIRQYNCVDWTDAAGLATRLHHRIEAIRGSGPLTDGGNVA